MRTSALILNKAKEVSAAYKILQPYVKHDEYFAYLGGLHDAVSILQNYEEQAASDAEELAKIKQKVRGDRT